MYSLSHLLISDQLQTPGMVLVLTLGLSGPGPLVAAGPGALGLLLLLPPVLGLTTAPWVMGIIVPTSQMMEGAQQVK